MINKDLYFYSSPHLFVINLELLGVASKPCDIVYFIISKWVICHVAPNLSLTPKEILIHLKHALHPLE